MKISIFGLGYVGCVSAACLAKEGHEVIGVDPNLTKVELINNGKSPIIEKDLDNILSKVISGDEKGSLVATDDGIRAAKETEVSLICVGTPSNINGSLKLDYVKNCAQEIGEGLKNRSGYHVVVARSTMLPGTVEDVIIREIEYRSGKKVGQDFGAVMNPEFLRESTSIDDFYNPPVTVIGEYDSKSGALIEKMYHFLNMPFEHTDIKTAEMMKYANNAFHGLKVAFANEIGLLCKKTGIDSHRVMEIFCMDDKLNISSYYFKPGFAFGGSCLPKDLRAINYKAKLDDLNLPVLSSILESNRKHIETAIESIIQTGKKKIGILGLSFKAGTDDLRESPIVILTEALIGKGYDLRIYDKNVSLAKLVGANKQYIEKEIPHISSLLLENMDEVIDHSEMLVIGNNAEEFMPIIKKIPENKMVFDLVRLSQDYPIDENYEGICW